MEEQLIASFVNRPIKYKEGMNRYYTGTLKYNNIKKEYYMTNVRNPDKIKTANKHGLIITSISLDNSNEVNRRNNNSASSASSASSSSSSSSSNLNSMTNNLSQNQSSIFPEIKFENINFNNLAGSMENFKKPLNKKIYKKIGIIKGHGSLENSICLVPDNLQLFIPIDKKEPFKHMSLSINDIDSLIDIDQRGNYISGEGGELIYGGTPIMDMLISFTSTYGESRGESKNNSNVLAYSFIGIITKSLSFVPESSRVIAKSPPRNTNGKINHVSIKRESLKDHNDNIISGNIIYGKTLYLSQILNLISNHKKINNTIPSLYILMSCRSYRSNNNVSPRRSPPLMRLKSTGRTYRNIFNNFIEKIFNKLHGDITLKHNSKIRELIINNIIRFIEFNRIETVNFNFLFCYLIGRKDLLDTFMRDYADKLQV